MYLGLEFYIQSTLRCESSIKNVRFVASCVVIFILGLVWYLEEADSFFMNIDSSVSAKAVYILSALLFFIELLLQKLRTRDYQELITNVLLTLMKPLMLAGGIES